jgi:acyl carrier protein phosphodiesterase
MNYLGHLYFSNQNTDLMLNNLYGDFIKGKDLSKFSSEIQKGVKRHLKIDDFIDNHIEIQKLGRILSPELPKVYPIAFDLYFDHFLAKYWNKWNEIELNDFLNQFYTKHDELNEEYSEKFKLFFNKLKKYNWLAYYPTLFGLHKSCNGVSRKISFENQLFYSLSIYLKNEHLIEDTFHKFILDAPGQTHLNINY